MEVTLTQIRESAARHGVPLGLHVQIAADAQRRIAEGWQLIAVGSELRLMLEGAGAVVTQLNPGRTAGEMAKY